MTDAQIGGETRRILEGFQRNEITEHLVYRRLAGSARGANREVLARIAEDERRHYGVWKNYTGTEVSPNRLKVLKYTLISTVFGLTFTIKLMERGEAHAQRVYDGVIEAIPEAGKIIMEESEHERKLIGMIDEERLAYVGSMILGLNDALVELTGTIAGLTFALKSTGLVGIAGLITGVAASLSMMSSEYLSTKAEGGGKNPVKASLFTGAAYVATVALLVAPYFIFRSYYSALAQTLVNVILIILVFTYYISVAKDQPFWKRFTEMAGISLGVAAVSFLIGLALRSVVPVDV